MDLERLVEIGPALIIVLVGIVVLWKWRSKFRSSQGATEKDQQFNQAMTPILIFAAICFVLVAIIYIFEL